MGRVVFSALLLSTLLSSTSWALSPSDYSFQTSPVNRELTTPSVHTIFQDSQGFLWFLTTAGLNRHDGHTVTRFRSARGSDPSKNSLTDQHTTGIAQDKEGNLWVATKNGGLNRIDAASGVITSLRANGDARWSSNRPISDNIYTVFHSADGKIWLGYDKETGFSSLDPKTGYFTHYSLGEQDRPRTLVSFAEYPAGVLWAAVTQQGLIKFDSNLQQLEAIQVPSSPSAIHRPTHIMKDSQNDLWITTNDSGLFYYNISTNHFENYKIRVFEDSFRPADSFYMSMEDKVGNIWVATRAGLTVLDRDSNTLDLLGLGNSEVKLENARSIFQDKSGIIWAGTYTGVVYGTKSIFGKIDEGLGLADDSVNAFTQTGDGRLWVGTNRGINSVLTDNFQVEPQENYAWESSLLEPYVVMSLLGEGSILWVGTLNAGLRRLNIDTGEIRVFKSTESDSSTIGANGITSIFRTSSGLLLIGTYGGGLSIYNDSSQTFERLTHDSENTSSIGSDVVLAITQDSAGDIWLGTDNGLSLFEPETRNFTTFGADPNSIEPLSSNMAWALHEDKEGTLWIGTQSGGLNAWGRSERAKRQETFKQYYDNVGLPSADIYAIRSDDNGDIWLSHNYGLSKLNPKSGKLHNYSLSDGLQTMDFNFASSYRDSLGRVYFGGNKGFNIVDPSTTSTDRYKAPLVITEFRVSNQTRTLLRNKGGYEKVVLDHNFQSATFSFSSLDYKNPAATQYRYRLDSYEDWVYNGTNRIVQFPDLPSDLHYLTVQGSNSDGIWNEDGIRLQIQVRPDPWFSVWAYTIYALTLLAALTMMITRQSRKAYLAAERQHELELMVQARTDDMQKAIVAAEEANSAKSNFLATMSHEIRTPMHGMIGMTELLLNTRLTEQQKRFAKAAHSSGQALLSLINDILDFSKIEASRVEVECIEFSLVELMDEIVNVQSEPALRRGLQLSSICEASVPSIVKGDPTKIRQILLNLVTNSIKFTHEGTIEIIAETTVDEARPSARLLHLTVSDTGIGMDEKTQSKVFGAFIQADASTTREYGGTGLGLAISRKLTDVMGGRIELNSTPGSGTSFTIELPIEIASDIQEEADFSSFQAKALVENLSTFRMVSSHFDRFGISTTKLEIKNIAEECIAPNTIIVMDEELAETHTQLADYVRQNSHLTGVLLIPLASIAPKSIPEGWLTLGKPITSSSLRETLLKAKDGPKESTNTEILTEKAPREDSFSILVAEDVETNQKIVREILQMLGCNVQIAANGREAVELYSSYDFDLIFMDCQMPIIDGYEATAQIRLAERKNGRPPIPIVALTAGTSSEDKARCLKAGMDHHLPKPFTVADISDTLEKTLGLERTPDVKAENQHSVASVTELQSVQLNRADIINLRSIENIREVERQTGKEILNEIFAGFITQMNTKLAEASVAIDGEDLLALKKIAHAMKSMSANMGADKVRLLSAALETDCDAGKKSRISCGLTDIEQAFNEFVTEFNLLQHDESLKLH